ncbi:protein root primordium defective 1, partial [Tanacetum coccineum]
LRTKILDWLDGFQKLPYVSPYEKCPDLYPDSDVTEKRVVGLLHELLSLFVEHLVQRKRESKVILRNRRLRNQFVCSGDTHDGSNVPHKCDAIGYRDSADVVRMSLLIVALEDHNPKLVYRSEVNKVAEIICPWLRKSLKKMCKAHPLAKVRTAYNALVNESKVILKNRRLPNQSFCSGDGDLDENDLCHGRFRRRYLDDYNPTLDYKGVENEKFLNENHMPWQEGKEEIESCLKKML